ncbi:hypothetical protein AMAG_01719 [Allomyces macrogynus ATCC 38327]|uniref:Transforming acidic coiled-coil-containing protein C-terminal domain-containing protein n=1 Tax=Allomyces macrogynus (strain ATCC 38327) TaxID=578462 RepID=A0A0L0S0I0_ALLM3|nr:hypothetical protein AMAG_01719 [Allomyces macrogynus ATCC 38327]|eukprot:KNE55849.1 hypothetical protein AMAG_01719 [Allomyces macrogynus ATCC 38327]
MISDEPAANAPAPPLPNPSSPAMATPAKSTASTMATPAKSPATLASAATMALSPARKRSLSGNDDHAAHRPDGAPHPPVEQAVDTLMDDALTAPDDSTLGWTAAPTVPAQETVDAAHDTVPASDATAADADAVMDEASGAPSTTTTTTTTTFSAPACVPPSPARRAGPATPVFAPAPVTPATAVLAAKTPIPATPAPVTSSTPSERATGTPATRTATPAACFVTPVLTATPAAARTATPAPVTPAPPATPAPTVSPRSELRYSDHDLARIRAEIKAELLAEIAASAPPPGTPRSTPQYSARDVDLVRAQVTAELEAQHHTALTELDTQLRALRDRNARLELEHREMLTILADADEKLAQLERDAGESRARVAQLEQNLADTKDKAKVESDKFKELETEYLRVRVRHQDLVADLDRARAKHVEDALVMANMREDLRATEAHARKVGEYTAARLDAANLEISKCHHAYKVEVAALRAKLAAAESARKLAEEGERSVRDRCVELTKISDELVGLLDAKVAQAEALWCEYAARVEGMEPPGELPAEKREREEKERKDAARAAKAARRGGAGAGAREIGDNDAVENMGADDAMLMADL